MYITIKVKLFTAKTKNKKIKEKQTDVTLIHDEIVCYILFTLSIYCIRLYIMYIMYHNSEI